MSWSTDYKGEFLLGNRQYCYPLTVTDRASRYLLTCEALSSTKEDYAFIVFERLFKERGLPANIRSDNGAPFASTHALFNLSKLAVWWLRLGIGIERIKPGGKGVVVSGCPTCKKRINTMNQLWDHLAEDVMPALIEKLSEAKPRITLGRTCLKRDSKQRTVQSYLAEKSYSKS
jgi:hypothetical protein